MANRTDIQGGGHKPRFTDIQGGGRKPRLTDIQGGGRTSKVLAQLITFIVPMMVMAAAIIRFTDIQVG